MPDNANEIKAVLDDLSTTDLTPSARLVAVIHALGIEDPKEIERLVGLKPAGARKARCQLKDHRAHSSATPVALRHSSSETLPQERSHSSVLPSRIRAHFESPSEILNTRKLVASNARAPDENQIEGLNGSTSMYVEWLASWLSEWAPDHESARQILTSNIEIYGPDKVRAGMVELKTLIAGGEKPRNLAKAFPAFVKNASTEARPVKAFHATKADARHGAFMAAVDAMEVK